MLRRTLLRSGLIILPVGLATGVGANLLFGENLFVLAAHAWPTYKSGSRNEDVVSIQYMLRQYGATIDADGIFGPQTEAAVKSFQSKHGLTADGIVGPLTWEKLIVSTKKGSSGNAVRATQRQLNFHGADLHVDGEFGPLTETTVKSFQSKHGLTVDGIAGINTWFQLVVTVPGASNPPTPTSLPDINSFGQSIEGYASYVPQSTCGSAALPGVVGVRDMFLKAFPNTTSSGIMRACNVGGTSEHKEGRAWDWGVSVGNPSAQRGLDWLLATDKYGNKHAMVRRLGIMYIIWNHHIWASYRVSEGWRTYSGSNPHTDHIHISFSWAGANKQTSFWK
jgi:peptidoglycan hydrolase-like protein with peptidoglycan-binding domain